MANILINNILCMHKGDSIATPIFINIGTKTNQELYKLNDNDIIYVSIMEPNQEFNCGIIRKIYSIDNWSLTPEGEVIFKLEPSDTENVLPGRYFIEIKIKLYNEKIATIVPRTKFYIYE